MSVCTFRKPWNRVVEGAVRKYPNPLANHVTGLDVIDRGIDTKGRLVSHRLLRVEWGLPSWVTTV